uniref:Adenylate kinase 5 n=1 Tax=Astyanax mexicanus TaxID=7994 RepID=A0A3B1JHD2_ASTMX
MNTNDAKEYLSRREIPQLFESLLTGLMYYRPDDPIDYLECCLKKVRELGGTEKVRWDTFVGQEKKSLPPLNGGQSRRSFFRNGMSNSPNFPYRRYDRLPPIHQFSIESDSDLSETAELIEEYEVFDPSRPRPKVILIIGGPGSGKGTQSLKIAERYGFEYVSVGELLRKRMIHNATSNRKWSLIAKIITNGELAPQETTITEIKQKIMKIPDANGIVIDGFPRDVGQALSFEDQICTPDLVVFLACSNQRLKERLEKRAEQQGRPDDNPKATERRLANFKQNAVPLVKYFQEKGLIVTLVPVNDKGGVFVCMVGGPGSGKALQCEKIEEQYGLKRLCPRDILCSELQSHSERGRFFRDVLERGEQLPEDTLLDLLCESMESTVRHGKGFLVSGFPRDLRQAEEYEAKMGKPCVVLLLECCSDTMSRRLQQRTCSSLRSREARDRDAHRRVDSFCSTITPVIHHYEHKGVLHKIDAEQPPDEVFEQICLALDSC